jgi:hypothetical protein
MRVFQALFDDLNILLSESEFAGFENFQNENQNESFHLKYR